MKVNLFAPAHLRICPRLPTGLALLLCCFNTAVPGLAQLLPTLQFAASSCTVAENAGSVTLVVQRLNDATTAVRVDFATVDGTATSGLKYTATNGTLAFAAGETNKVIVVPILNEGLVEGTKTFRVGLSNPSGGAVLGTPTNATVSITDNDTGLQFEFGSYSVAEDAGAVLIGVARGDDSNFSVSVDFATSDGSATNGVAYTATNGTLTFSPGETVKLITIPILNDGVKAGSKYFRLTLSNPTNQVLGAQKTATVTILDNDPGVQCEFNRYWVQKTDGAVTVKVLRGNDKQLGPLTVDFVTSDLSAKAGVHYVTTKGTLAFTAGEWVKTFTIPILYHDQPDPDLQFKLTLGNLTGGGGLGSNTTATITILDTTGMVAHRFDRIAVLSDRSVQLTLQGGVSQRFRDYFDLYPIEVSSNLVDWTPLVTLQRTNAVTNALVYTDAATGNWPARFYRTPTNHLITPFSVKPTGPYAAGVISRLLTDPSRRNRYAVSTNGSFMVSVWYPAAPQAGRWPGPLLDAPIAHDPFLSEQLHNAGYPAMNVVDRTPQMVGYALPDAPFAANPTPCPILLCSPQGYGWRASLAEKAANFASHGYVVVVSDPCDAVATTFPDGTDLTQPQSGWPFRSDCIQDRVRDLAFMLDELTGWNANDPVFAGRLDLAKVAAMGTCSGFDAAAQFCRFDARCQAAILISCTPGRWVSPWNNSISPIPELEQSGVGKPLLVVFGDYTDAFDYYDFLFNKAAKDAVVFQIQGVGNAGYGAMILVQDFYLLLEPYRLAAGKEGARTITDYSLWFLNRHLKGSSAPMPPPPNYPRILGFKQK